LKRKDLVVESNGPDAGTLARGAVAEEGQHLGAFGRER